MAPKRSLILAGGGLKVAFQAGVLQVWLDEAGLTFDHADGASGGVFNLVRYCEGHSGSAIADGWRTFHPLRALHPHLPGWLLFPWASSLFRYDRFRRNVLRKQWAIDWDKVRRSQRLGTFNAYNFSRHELEVLPQDALTEDFLVACVSLPTFFPPVWIDGDQFLDAVYVTDANLEEAIARGADELWIIWTVSDHGRWKRGPLAHYFQIIESSANGALRGMLDRIAHNNLRIEDGQAGEFGRPIEVKLLKADVPDVHYLINVRNKPFRRAVDQGVDAARAWCRERGLLTGASPRVEPPPTSLRFTEEMKGFASAGEGDYFAKAQAGRSEKLPLSVTLTIEVDDVDHFVDDRDHEASVTGTIHSPLVGGDRPIEEGFFNLFTLEDEPQRRYMRYRLFHRDLSGQPVTATGFKVIEDQPGADLWPDTTTLYTRLLRGHVRLNEEDGAEVLATGIIQIYLVDFLRQLTTFRTSGPSSRDEARAMVRFGRFFLGTLWELYLPRFGKGS